MDKISRRRLIYATQSHRKDAFIEFIRAELKRCFTLYEKDEVNTRYKEIMQQVTSLVDGHRRTGTKSRLHHIVPSVSKFFTELDLVRAYDFYNEKARISRRSFVAPSFNEVRHMLNVAQVHGTSKLGLRFISFDGDQTLYQDGSCISNPAIINALVELLNAGVIIAIVTAASYADRASGYETRLGLLLEAFRSSVSAEKLGNFYVVGGECNYMFSCNAEAHLEYIPREDWQPGILDVTAEQIKPVLDLAEKSIIQCMSDFAIKGRVIRKERAVGIIPLVPGDKLRREALDETACAVAATLNDAGVDIPFCAFNGGNDVFVDIGNKSVGIRGLLKRTETDPSRCLHVGDQFSTQGNDFACRQTCATIWITKPIETAYILKFIIAEMKQTSAPAANDGDEVPSKRPRIAAAGQ